MSDEARTNWHQSFNYERASSTVHDQGIGACNQASCGAKCTPENVGGKSRGGGGHGSLPPCF